MKNPIKFVQIFSIGLSLILKSVCGFVLYRAKCGNNSHLSKNLVFWKAVSQKKKTKHKYKKYYHSTNEEVLSWYNKFT